MSEATESNEFNPAPENLSDFLCQWLEGRLDVDPETAPCRDAKAQIRKVLFNEFFDKLDDLARDESS
jgi:hypothetical protein